MISIKSKYAFVSLEAYFSLAIECLPYTVAREELLLTRATVLWRLNKVYQLTQCVIYAYIFFIFIYAIQPFSRECQYCCF